MLAHYSSFQDIAMGYFLHPIGLLWLLVDRSTKPIFYNDKLLPHNMSTIPAILNADKKDFEIERLLKR
ncbi:hypothetical protein P5G62_009555 [Neobacillus sp. 179-C4.2 HS]|uniref:Uncharacterized protein n=1 Tax=Neobacillus driksii TaxID=3035913 RepID=A0ABV4YR63_9BACI|nr:hypothetical protein [Neobacillus sp. 179.-C4.2 HS]MDP5194927.1 hypothetical protein [Neobacillus sp. 179.-C4.2 HS]